MVTTDGTLKRKKCWTLPVFWYFKKETTDCNLNSFEIPSDPVQNLLARLYCPIKELTNIKLFDTCVFFGIHTNWETRWHHLTKMLNFHLFELKWTLDNRSSFSKGSSMFAVFINITASLGGLVALEQVLNEERNVLTRTAQGKWPSWSSCIKISRILNQWSAANILGALKALVSAFMFDKWNSMANENDWDQEETWYSVASYWG